MPGDAAGPLAKRERRAGQQQASEDDAGPERRQHAGAAAETMVTGGFVFVHRAVYRVLLYSSTVATARLSTPVDGDAAVRDAQIDLGAAAVELRLESSNAPPGAFCDGQAGDGDVSVHGPRVQRGLGSLGNLERDPSVRAFEAKRAGHLGHLRRDRRVDACRVDRSPHGRQLDAAVHDHGLDVAAQPVGLEPAVVAGHFEPRIRAAW